MNEFFLMIDVFFNNFYMFSKTGIIIKYKVAFLIDFHSQVIMYVNIDKIYIATGIQRENKVSVGNFYCNLNFLIIRMLL
jgi:hypothetical protein